MIFFSSLLPLFLLVLLTEASIFKHLDKKALNKKVDNSQKTLAFSIATSESKKRMLSEEDTACLRALGLTHLCSFIEEKLLSSSQKIIFWSELFSFSTLEDENATLADALVWVTNLESEINALPFSQVFSLLKLVAFLKGEKIPEKTDSLCSIIKFQRSLNISLSYSQLLSLSKAITLQGTEVIMNFSDCFEWTRIPAVAKLLNFIFGRFLASRITKGISSNLTVISIYHLRSNPIYNFNLLQMIETNSPTLQKLHLVNVHIDGNVHKSLTLFPFIQSLSIRTFHSVASHNWAFPFKGEFTEFTEFEVPSSIFASEEEFFVLDRRGSILHQSTTAFLRSNTQLETLSIDCNFAGLETAEFKEAIKSLANLKSLSIPINGNIQEYLSEDDANSTIERLSFADYNSFGTCQNWNFIQRMENLKFFGIHSDFGADGAFFSFIQSDRLHYLSIGKKQFSQSEMAVFAQLLPALKSLKALALNLSNEHGFDWELAVGVEALFVNFRRVRSIHSEQLISNLPRGAGVKYLFLVGDINEGGNATECDQLKREIRLKFPNLVKLKVKGPILESEGSLFTQIYDFGEPIYGGLEIVPGMFF